MKIVDSWKMNGKTAIYCTGKNAEAYSQKESVLIGGKKYKIIGFDILTSISGIKALMLLLDTADIITVNQTVK